MLFQTFFIYSTVRYYTLAGLNTYSDFGWSEEDLVRLFNSDICNDWGNLISRVLHLIDLKSVKISDIETEFKSKIDSLVQEVNDLWSDFKVKDALVKTNEIVKLGNKYINDEKPWSSENHSEILNNLQ